MYYLMKNSYCGETETVDCFETFGAAKRRIKELVGEKHYKNYKSFGYWVIKGCGTMKPMKFKLEIDILNFWFVIDFLDFPSKEKIKEKSEKMIEKLISSGKDLSVSCSKSVRIYWHLNQISGKDVSEGCFDAFFDGKNLELKEIEHLEFS